MCLIINFPDSRYEMVGRAMLPKKCIAKKNRSLVLMNMFFVAKYFFHMAKTMPARQ